MDLLRAAGDDPPEKAFLEILDTAVSNYPGEGRGRDIWTRHVLPARVLSARVVAHIALLAVLEGATPPATVAGYDVTVSDHAFTDRGALTLASGRVQLVHRRTGRAETFLYAAVHLGALDVVGACRPAADRRADTRDLAHLRAAFAKGIRLTQLLRLISDGFGPEEFDVSAALPDASDQLLTRAAQGLADRFGAEMDRLYTDHRDIINALTAAGFALPEELRAPAQLALARRLEADLVALGAAEDLLALSSALTVVSEAEETGVGLDLPPVRTAATAAVYALVARAVVSGRNPDVEAAVALIDLLDRARVTVDVARSQEVVYGAAMEGSADSLAPLGVALGLAPGGLGVPR
jgi:hypothetical protein